MQKIPLVAHRGYCAAYPENSLESIRAALECGALAVEFDVQLTRDHVAVVCHDDNLLRTAGIDVSIPDSVFSDIASLSVGEPERFADQFAHSYLPSLSQMVELLQAFPDSIAFVEVKVESIEAFGQELVNRIVLETIAPIRSRCVLISDDLDAMVAARERAGIPIGWIIHQWSEPDRALANRAGPEYLVVNHKYFPSHNNTLWPGDWHWVVYETSKTNKAMELLNMGIQWVETNSVCPMLDSLQQGQQDFVIAPILRNRD